MALLPAQPRMGPELHRSQQQDGLGRRIVRAMLAFLVAEFKSSV